MIRTGEEYRTELRDGREILINGERVSDVTTHAAFNPVVDLKARMHDIVREPVSARFETWVRWRLPVLSDRVDGS